MLNEIKSIKVFQEFSWVIVNNLKLKLKFKVISEEKKKISVNIKPILKNENVPQTEKKHISLKSGTLSMNDRLKLFNNKGKNLCVSTEGNINKQVPKKLVINPNLYGKDGTIRIISSKELNLIKKKEKLNTNANDNEKDLQDFLYGDREEDNIEVQKSNNNNKKSRNAQKGEKNFKDTLSVQDSKRISERPKHTNFFQSLLNRKPKDEPIQNETKEGKIEIKVNKNMMKNIDDTNSIKKPIIKNKEKNEENLKEIIDDNNEVIKTKTENKIIYKNRNKSNDLRKLKINLKNDYDISNTPIEDPLDELNKKKKEYYKKEYCNVESINYSQYLKKLKLTKNPIERETFCEGFFIASFPYQRAQVIENSQSFPSPCGHKKCSIFPAMKPEIIMRYPLKDTKNLELNNLAATICFPTGIKVCYNEEEPTNMIDDYLTSITNQKGERYYMMTYHFYQKVNNNDYTSNYEMHPLKNHLMKFGDSYLTLSDEGFTDAIVKKVQENLALCEELGYRDYVYVPFCLCIISKYPYAYEMTKCLQSIFNVMSEEEIMSYLKIDFKINDLIMYLINSVPIPIEKNTRVKFYIPFFEKGISLKYPKLDEINIVNINYIRLIELFSIENLIIIIRLLLFEKKILFIDDDYTRLSEVTDAIISLLYPFKWVHTYIPIMSDQMLKYLETFLPFLNGIHSSLMPLVSQVFNNGEIDDSEDVFLIYNKEGRIDLSSSLKRKKKKVAKYIQSNVPPLPISLEKNLKNTLYEIKDSYNNTMKKVTRYSRATKPVDPTQFDINIRDAFIQMFVDMFKEYPKYICILDNDVVFNKNSFMKTINKNDKIFFEEFIDTQLFQQFTQTIFTDDCNYFNKIISVEGDYKSEFIGTPLDVQVEKVYLMPPIYLGTEEKENKTIQKYICEYYPTNLESNFVAKDEYKNSDGIILPSHRVIPSITEIQDDDYINDNCLIYLLPNQNNALKKRTLVRETSVQLFETIKNQSFNDLESQALKKTFTNNLNEDLNEKGKDEIKEIIKDYLRKIFQSENIDYKDPKNKTEILNILKNKFGREFFISLLSSNLKNVVLLQSNSFSFLGFLIYNVLVESLQMAETDKLLEEVYLLIKTTLYFGIEHKKKTKTLFEDLKTKIRNYPLITQKYFWNIWFDKEISAKKEKGDSIKQIVILNICSRLVELEVSKVIIKDILDDLNNNAFEKSPEMGNQTQKMYMRKITQTKYILKENK